MGYGVDRRGLFLRKNKLLLVGGLAIALVLAQVSPPARASGSTVQVVVDAPELNLTGPAADSNAVTTTVSHFLIHGLIRHLNQIRLYVDGQFTDIIPLTRSATSFQYSLTLAPGMHTVYLVGVSDEGTEPTATFTISYSPNGSNPQPPANGGTTPPNSASGEKKTVGFGQGIASSGGGLKQQNAPMNSFFQRFMPLDWTKSRNEWVTDVLRVVMLLIGLLLLFFAELVLSIYQRIRSKWLSRVSLPLPLSLRRHRLVALRLCGLAIVVMVILFV